MSLWHSRKSHYLTVRRDAHTGVTTWNGISEWDAPKRNGSRIRTVMRRATWLTSRADAARWARRYKVELPEPPEL